MAVRISPISTGSLTSRAARLPYAARVAIGPLFLLAACGKDSRTPMIHAPSQAHEGSVQAPVTLPPQVPANVLTSGSRFLAWKNYRNGECYPYSALRVELSSSAQRLTNALTQLDAALLAAREAARAGDVSLAREKGCEAATLLNYQDGIGAIAVSLLAAAERIPVAHRESLLQYHMALPTSEKQAAERLIAEFDRWSLQPHLFTPGEVGTLLREYAFSLGAQRDAVAGMLSDAAQPGASTSRLLYLLEDAYQQTQNVPVDRIAHLKGWKIYPYWTRQLAFDLDLRDGDTRFVGGRNWTPRLPVHVAFMEFLAADPKQWAKRQTEYDQRWIAFDPETRQVVHLRNALTPEQLQNAIEVGRKEGEKRAHKQK